jgi:cysteine synthase A
MLPDTGERYMSTPLFEGIDFDMNEAELELSRSTPGYRFDAPPLPGRGQAASSEGSPAAPAASPEPEREPALGPALDEEASAFIDSVVRDNAVVLFALEWCEFSWSVRKLFAKLRIPYRSVDLDAVELQKRDLGIKIRAALRQRIGSPTIPQIYIGGRHVGGCMDLFDALAHGSAQELLSNAGVEYDRSANVDSRELLPQWVHPRNKG